MRGGDERTKGIFSYIRPEQRLPKELLVRPIHEIVDRALEALSLRFEALWGERGGQGNDRRLAALPARDAGGGQSLRHNTLCCDQAQAEHLGPTLGQGRTENAALKLLAEPARLHADRGSFGWINTIGALRKTKHRGRIKVRWTFTLTAAHNLTRLPHFFGTAS